MGPDQVLGVDHTHDVVDSRTAHRGPAVAVAGHLGHGPGHRQVGSDAPHIGPGHHHLPDQAVSEGDHRLDQFVFLGIDGLGRQRPIGHRQQLLLGHRRGTGSQRPWQEALGHRDQDIGQPTQRGDRREASHHRRRTDDHAVQRPKGDGPGQHVGQNEARDEQHGHRREGPAPTGTVGDDHREDSGGRHATGHHKEQDHAQGTDSILKEFRQRLGV